MEAVCRLGTMPQKWRTADQVTLFKRRDPGDPKNIALYPFNPYEENRGNSLGHES